MLKRIIRNKAFLLSSALMLGSAPVFAESPWDGKYNSTFPFQMSRASVCPKFLPIDIEIKIENGQISGFMFNNGGGNKDAFCKLYHNGSITGSIDDDGNLANDPTDVVITEVPEIEVTKTAYVIDNGDGTTNTGDTIVYTITVNNNGNTVVSSITLVDNFIFKDSLVKLFQTCIV